MIFNAAHLIPTAVAESILMCLFREQAESKTSLAPVRSSGFCHALEFNHQKIGVGITGVLLAMRCRRFSNRLTGGQLYSLTVAGTTGGRIPIGKQTRRIANYIDEVVRMRVLGDLVAGSVVIRKYPYRVILVENLVVLRIYFYRVLCSGDLRRAQHQQQGEEG